MISKKILISAITAATMISVSANAGELEDRILKLEKTIADMKAQKAEDEEIIDELDERVSDVEFRSYTDKISFGLGMRVESNHFTNTKLNGDKYSTTLNRIKVNINMKSKIADDMKFVGRLSMYKNWGDQTPRMTNLDYSQGRRPNSSELYVERAYVDWLTNKGSTVPFTVSLGRLSTSDGPSYNIKEDTKRKGTFSALAYDWAMDGVILTANLDKISSGTDVQFTYFTPSVQDNPKTISQIGYDSGIDDTTVTGLIVNKTFKKLSFGNSFQAYYIPATDTTVTVPGTDTASGNTETKNLGDMILTGAMMEFTKINGNIDFFTHYAQNEARPNGETISLKNGKSAGLLSAVPTATSTTVSTDSIYGHAIWVGTRYHINKVWKVGAEYNKGSKNWFSFTVGSNDPVNKLAVRGEVTEVYVTKSINKYANIRVGYIDINVDNMNSGMIFGSPRSLTDPNVVAQADALSDAGVVSDSRNLYISFNLLF